MNASTVRKLIYPAITLCFRLIVKIFWSGKTKWATHLREHDSDLKICNQAVFISLSENILAAKVNQVTMDRREHDGDAKIGLIAKTQNMIETCNSL